MMTLVRLVAEKERSVADASHAVGDREAGQVAAVTERLFPMLWTLLPIMTVARLVQGSEGRAPDVGDASGW